MVFARPPGSYDLCPVCGWEDDHVQLRHPGMRGGANKPCLREQQDELLQRYPVGVTSVGRWVRDPSWRPLRDDECITTGGPRTGLEYFHAATKDPPPYYWRVDRGSPETEPD